MTNGKTIYYLGFIILLALWMTMTILCYCGVITFDSRSLGGAILAGFILSASILGVIGALKVLYDQSWDRLSNKGETR